MPVKNIVSKDWVLAVSYDGTQDTKFPDGKPFAPPAILANAASTTSIQIFLTSPSLSADYYIVERSPNGTSGWVIVNDAAAENDFPLLDESLNASTQYFYRAKAVNQFAETAYSTVVSATTSGASSSWKLPTGYFMPAKMPLSAERVVHPRPNSETSSMAFHRNAFPGMLYEIPIVVQGGAWPFYYELVTAPPGMTIGNTVYGSDYGIIKWPSPSSGVHTVTVRVIDQDLSEVIITWTINVNTDWVRFVSPSGSNSNPGTFNQPWQTIEHAYNQISGGRAVCLLAGTYNPTLSSSHNMSSTKYQSLFGYPGAMPTINLTNWTSGGSIWWLSADTFISGINFNGTPNISLPRIFSTLDGHNRIYQYKNIFSASDHGGDSRDNHSFLFLGAGSTQRRYVAQINNIFNTLYVLNTNGWTCFDIYMTKYFVVEGNVFNNPPTAREGTGVIWVKGVGNEEGTIRANRTAQPWPGAIVDLYLGFDGTSGAPAPKNIEVCYNKLIMQQTNIWGSSSINVGGASQSGSRTGIWSYRNTFRGAFIIHRRDWPLQFTSQQDVVVSDATYTGQSATGHKLVLLNTNTASNVWQDPSTRPNITLSVQDRECHGSTSAGILDSDYNLTGTFRTAYLGRRGAEIYEL